MRCKLREHIRIKHGYTFDGDFFSDQDNGVVLVTPGNFAIGGGFQEGKGKYYIGEYPQEFVLKPGDLLVTMTDLSKSVDTLGYAALVPNDGRIYLHNQRIGLIEFLSEDIDKGYLHYLLRSRHYQRTIAGSSSGSTVHHTSPEKICQYEFDLPSKEEQLRIAEVLASYEHLIENNRKQIKLLEEAAQRLYKEWFIDLRFPSHETMPIDSETGLPEGWSRILLGEYTEFRRGKVITEKQTSFGTVPVVAGGLGPAYYHDTPNATAPVITISGSGANAGFTRLYNEDIWASDCSFVDSSNCEAVYFVFETVLLLGNGFKHLQRGSAQPHVYPKNINELNIVMPSEEILDNYEEYASCLFLKIRALEKQITLAKEARDRLIPNLMEGCND